MPRRASSEEAFRASYRYAETGANRATGECRDGRQCKLAVTVPAETFLGNRGNWHTILERQVINWQYRGADGDKRNEDKELYECSQRLNKAGFPEEAAIAFVACYWKWTKPVAQKRLGEAKSRHEGTKEVREARAKRLAGVGP